MKEEKTVQGNESENEDTKMDALIAAPDHHQLLFENEKVRVLNTRIRPGEITPVHAHPWPASLYVISWSDFMRYDAEGKLLFDSKDLTNAILPSTALWSEPLGPHALKNTGQNDLHVICVEIKN